jgi:hypothetical protein
VKTGISGENYNLEGRISVSRPQAWGSRTVNWTAPNANRQILIKTRNSGVHNGYESGVSIGSSTGPSTTSDTDAMFAVFGTGAPAGSDNVSLNFTGRIYAYSLGAGLTAQQAADYNAALTTFLDAIGRTA